MGKNIVLSFIFIILGNNLTAQIVVTDSVKMSNYGVDIAIYQDTLLYVAAHNYYEQGYLYERPGAGAVNIIGDTLLLITGNAITDAFIINAQSSTNLVLKDSLLIVGNGDDFSYYNLVNNTPFSISDLSGGIGIVQDASSGFNSAHDLITVISSIPDGFRIIINNVELSSFAPNRGFYGIAFNNNVVYAGADDSSLVTYSLSTFSFTDSLKLLGIARDIVVSDTLLICGNGTNVSLYSIADPVQPRFLENVAVGGSVNGLSISGNRLFVAAGSLDSSAVQSISIFEGTSGLTGLQLLQQLVVSAPVWAIEADLRNSDIFYFTTSDSMLYSALYGESVRIEQPATLAPRNAVLYANYPNPFNPRTSIKYTLNAAGNVSLRVYDILGKEVKTLFNGYRGVGNYNQLFDASALASGIYYYRLDAAGYSKTRKMLLVK